MLEEHSNKDMLLKETVEETIRTASLESIPNYIDSGIRQLNEHAEDYIERLNWNQVWELKNWILFPDPAQNRQDQISFR